VNLSIAAPKIVTFHMIFKTQNCNLLKKEKVRAVIPNF
jgi:hypothetical protein